MRAFKTVKANAGSAGVDLQTIAKFEMNLKKNLYKIWNRMSSGSYFPSSVKGVKIPKKDGGHRILGIPTVADRVAQTVVKMMLEPKLEPIFHKDSYGYRKNKSAIEAVGVTRERCWKYNWCLEFDIKGLFDNLDHTLLMKAVRKHVTEEWILLYVQRWLEAPTQMENGVLKQRARGTPQGGIISTLLSNLFLHYVFDVWMERAYPHLEWCRYADDGLIHCRTEQEARLLMESLKERFTECHLELHPEKTKIIYCKDERRKENYEHTKFDFLGFAFECRTVREKRTGKYRRGFNPAASKQSIQAMKDKTREQKRRMKTDLKIEEIAEMMNPILRGWIHYYGQYTPSKLRSVLVHVNATIKQWLKRKYRKLTSRTKAGEFLFKIYRKNPVLFAHWEKGMIDAYA
jgi:RNA-directed DNA polymerase